MMWYEPYANPGDWALAKKDNIKELVSHWHNCKYNPAVIKPFLSDGNFDNFTALAYLYRKTGANRDQVKDLVKLCFDALDKCIDSHTAWKFNKSPNDNAPIAFNEFYHKVLELSLALGPEGAIVSDKIINHYDDIDDVLKDQFVTAIIHMYGISMGIYTDEAQERTVDFNYAQSIVKEIIKKINVDNAGRKSIYMQLEHTSAFTTYAYALISHGIDDDLKTFNIIFNMVADYFEKDSNYKIVSRIMPNIDPDVIHDVYNTLKNVSVTNDAGNQSSTAAMIAGSGYSKDDLCKVTRLCINNLNQFGGVCLDKSCEEAIIKGIMEYKPANEQLFAGPYDIDKELTILEYMTMGGTIATEASDDDEDYDEDYEPRRKSVKDTSNDEFDSEGFDKPKPKRDFDSEYRKFKSNASKVATSIDKVADTVKNFALSTTPERGERKVLKNDSLTKVLARLFATIAIFDVSKFLGVLWIIVRIANSKKTTERERVKLITEIKNEIELIDDQLNSVETPEAKTSLIKTRQNLKDALRKIQSNKAKYMTDGAKQAVVDMREKNKVRT